MPPSQQKFVKSIMPGRGSENLSALLQEALFGSGHSRLPTRLAALNRPRLLELAGLNNSALLAL